MTPSIFDAIMAGLVIIGMWPVLTRLTVSGSPNPVERRLRGILMGMTALFMFRIPHFGLGWPVVGALAYASAIATVFLVFIFFEALIRRHMPVVLKVFMAAGCSVFGLLAISGLLHENHDLLLAFGAFLTIASLWTLLSCLFRDRKAYNSAENRFIDLCAVTLVLLGPFFLTDMPVYDFGPIPRIGAVGALLFASVSIYSESIFQRKASTFRALMRALSFSALLTAAVVALIPGISVGTAIQAFTLMLSVNLIFHIHQTVRHLQGQDPQSKFVKALSESDRSSREKFLSGLNRYFGDFQSKIVTAAELPGCDFETLRPFFESRQTSTFNLAELRQMMEEDEASLKKSEIDAIEWMINVLETNGMNHLCLIDRRRGPFVLVNVTAIGYSPQVRLRAGVLADTAALLPN